MRMDRSTLGVIALLTCCLRPLTAAADEKDPEYKGRRLSAWIRDLDAGDPWDRRAAADWLGELGPDVPQAAGPLKRLLADPDEGVRRVAAAALLNVDPLAALPHVEGRRDRRRALALAALSPAGPDGKAPALDKEARAALLDAVKDDDARTRLLALAALSRFSPDDARPHVRELARALKDGEESRLIALAALYRLGPAAEDAVPELLDALLDGKTFEPPLVAAAALGRVGKPAVKPLLGLLDGKGKSSATVGVLAVAQIGKEAAEAAPALRALRQGDDTVLSCIAAYALVRIDPTERKPSEKVLRDRGDAGVLALAWLHPEDAGPAPALFAKLLRGKPEPVPDSLPGLASEAAAFAALFRPVGAYGLAELGPAAKPEVEDLRKALDDKEPLTAALAAYALARASPDDVKTAAAALKRIAREAETEEGWTALARQAAEGFLQPEDHPRLLAWAALCDAVREKGPGDRFPTSYVLNWTRQAIARRPAPGVYAGWKRRHPFVRGLAEEALRRIEADKKP
jgi:HEAT repeat protein